MRTVIVGNGVCGMEAALALRGRDSACAITIVSTEHDHFFSRPALMYVLAGQLSLRDTEPFDRRIYDRMHFERVRGRVTSLDAAGKSLCLDGGAVLEYDRLLLAVGSRGRPGPWPGSDGPGVHAFVDLRDLEALDAEAEPGKRAVVIGGGLIGIEAAEVLHHRGLHVTFLIRESWYFPLALDHQESVLVAEQGRVAGIDVRLDTEVEAILRTPSGHVRGVRAAGAEIPADLVVVAIGVIPNTGFLPTSGLELSRSGAIEVDEGLRTNIPDIWAAGDCANVTWFDGTRRPEQLWYTARDQGRLAARSMLGDAAVYRRGTWYNSAKFLDIEYTTAGWVPPNLKIDNTPVVPEPGVTSWFQRTPERTESQRIIVRDGCVVGFSMLGSRWDHEVLLRWIEGRRSLPWVLEHLHEARFDEEFQPSPPRLEAAGAR